MGPEEMRRLGSPHCLVILQGTAVSPLPNWPMTGIGQFLQVPKGSLTVAVWSAQTLLDRGCSVGRQWKFLSTELSAKVFAEWIDINTQAVNFEENDMFWLPYGCYGIAIL